MTAKKRAAESADTAKHNAEDAKDALVSVKGRAAEATGDLAIRAGELGRDVTHKAGEIARSVELTPGETLRSLVDRLPNGSAKTVNVGNRERLLSLLAGVPVVLLGVRRSSRSGLGLSLIGSELMYRGITGNCTIYEQLGIDRSRGVPAT